MSTVAVKFAGSIGPDPSANDGIADDGKGAVGEGVGGGDAWAAVGVAAATSDVEGPIEGAVGPQPPARTPAAQQATTQATQQS